jgi:hypothetical protein
LLALASLDLACRDHRPDFSATFTTIAFDDSSLQWLGISHLIAEPEGPSFISRTVTQPPCGPALLVTQDPKQTSTTLPNLTRVNKTSPSAAAGTFSTEYADRTRDRFETMPLDDYRPSSAMMLGFVTARTVPSPTLGQSCGFRR